MARCIKLGGAIGVAIGVALYRRAGFGPVRRSGGGLTGRKIAGHVERTWPARSVAMRDDRLD